jgi:hypothetical protein
MATSAREQLMQVIQTLSDEKVESLLQTAQLMSGRPDRPAYDPAKDETVGFITDAPSDFSQRVKPRYRLQDLLDGITDENRHGETDWGPAVGNEAW